MNLDLVVLEEEMVVWRLPADAPVPESGSASFWSVTRTPDELSVVSTAAAVPSGVPQEGEWRCIGVKGPLDFGMVGVLAALSRPLARAGISIFVVSTFDTDYVLVKSRQLEVATLVLEQAGHIVVERPRRRGESHVLPES